MLIEVCFFSCFMLFHSTYFFITFEQTIAHTVYHLLWYFSLKNIFSLQCAKWSCFLLWIFHYFMHLLQAWEKRLAHTPYLHCPPPSSLLASFASLPLLFHFIFYLIMFYISVSSLFMFPYFYASDSQPYPNEEGGTEWKAVLAGVHSGI